MAYFQYRFKPSLIAAGYSPDSMGGPILRLRDGRTLDVPARLTAGSGTITIDEQDTNGVAALDEYWPIERYATTSSPPVGTEDFASTTQDVVVTNLYFA